MEKIAEVVAGMARPVAEKHGCEIWDAEYVREGGSQYLRVYIDRPDGVSIDHCEAVSRELEALLDEADFIKTSYIFEVSSAGAERALRRPEDFARFMGSLVAVHLYKARGGRREFVGRLSAFNDGEVAIETGSEREVFQKNEIALVRLRIEI
jgi:ribosome maturation factor RimP